MPKKKEVKIVTVSSYKPRITLNKALIELVIILASAGLAWGIDSLLPQLISEYPQYLTILTLVAVILRTAHNYIKHYDDTQKVII